MEIVTFFHPRRKSRHFISSWFPSSKSKIQYSPFKSHYMVMAELSSIKKGGNLRFSQSAVAWVVSAAAFMSVCPSVPLSVCLSVCHQAAFNLTSVNNDPKYNNKVEGDHTEILKWDFYWYNQNLLGVLSFKSSLQWRYAVCVESIFIYECRNISTEKSTLGLAGDIK